MAFSFAKNTFYKRIRKGESRLQIMKININKKKIFLLKATFMENAFKEDERLLKEENKGGGNNSELLVICTLR